MLKSGDGKPSTSPPAQKLKVYETIKDLELAIQGKVERTHLYINIQIRKLSSTSFFVTFPQATRKNSLCKQGRSMVVLCLVPHLSPGIFIIVRGSPIIGIRALKMLGRIHGMFGHDKNLDRDWTNAVMKYIAKPQADLDYLLEYRIKDYSERYEL